MWADNHLDGESLKDDLYNRNVNRTILEESIGLVTSS